MYQECHSLIWYDIYCTVICHSQLNVKIRQHAPWCPLSIAVDTHCLYPPTL